MIKMKTVAEKLVDFLKVIEGNMKSQLYESYGERLFHQAFGAVTYTVENLTSSETEKERIINLWENIWRDRLADLI